MAERDITCNACSAARLEGRKMMQAMMGGAILASMIHVVGTYVEANWEGIYDRYFHASSAQESFFARAVHKGIGVAAKVVCVGPTHLAGENTDGEVDFWRPPFEGSNYGVIKLKKGVCRALVHFSRDVDQPHRLTASEIISVETLAHEVDHIKGDKNEHDAQCFAIQEAEPLAIALGASAAAARYIQVRGMRLERRMGDSPAYRFEHCYPGGPLDEHLAPHPVFPQHVPHHA